MQRTQRLNGMLRFVEHDAAGRMERMVAGPGEVVGQLGDPRLVRHGRDADTARSPAARSDLRRGRRGRGTSARPWCSTARARRS